MPPVAGHPLPATHNRTASAARELRQAVFAVSVLSDIDIVPANLGVSLSGRPPVWVTWSEIRTALAGQPATSARGRRRLADWLLARRWAADLSVGALGDRLRVVGLPVGHAAHPGPSWVRAQVAGGALQLGLGAVQLDPARPDRVVLLPAASLLEAGTEGEGAAQQAFSLLESLGALAAERALADPAGVLRPCGDNDVVTLLGARTFRAALAGTTGGLAAVAVPMRRRGWSRLSLIDPAFAPCAAAATVADERGFARPLLVTADAVAMVAGGGRANALLLRGPTTVGAGRRDVLYR